LEAKSDIARSTSSSEESESWRVPKGLLCGGERFCHLFGAMLFATALGLSLTLGF